MDPLSAIGLAAAIAQFVELAARVVERVSDFSSSVHQVPQAFRRIHTELPLIIDCLERIKAHDEKGVLVKSTREALRPVIQECFEETGRLNEILIKAIPSADASSWERKKKAITSLGSDKKVEQIADALGKYISTLTLHQVLANASAAPTVEEPAPSYSKPVWLVPFDKNSLFVGRNGIFEAIAASLKVKDGSQPKAALCGLGGIGKSQIVLEYCYRRREVDKCCSVFWINAATVARFEESIKRLASECGLAVVDDAQTDIASSVKDHLESHAGTWLMVVDNVDDKAFYRESMRNGKTPSQCIPHCQNGSLLYTTRSSDIAVDLASPATPIDVEEMSPEDGLNLVRKRLQGEHSEESIFELLKELEHIPLAITQAVSFILKRRKTIPQYLEQYRSSDTTKIKLLIYEFSDHGRQGNSMESVAKTWALSFKSIRDSSPRAAELLCLMSFLQYQSIPKALLQSEDEDDFDFEDAMALLKAFSFADADETDTVFRTHRLVQLATQWWLQKGTSNEVDKWAFKALKAVSTQFPAPMNNVNNDWFRLCEPLFPHGELVLRHGFERQTEEVEIERARLLAHTGRYLDGMGAYIEGEERLEKSLDIRQKHLGEKHVDTLKSMSLLVWHRAMCTEDRGVLPMANRLYELRCEVLGETDPDTIDTLSDLASAIALDGDMRESEALERLALERSEQVLGPTHHDTLNCKVHLAGVLSELEEYEEALKLQREVYDARLELVGPEDRTFLVDESLLATLMQLAPSGENGEAIVMHQRNFDNKVKVYGLDHRQTLITVINLVISLRDEGRLAAGRDLCEQVLDEVKPLKDNENWRDTLERIYDSILDEMEYSEDE